MMINKYALALLFTSISCSSSSSNEGTQTQEESVNEVRELGDFELTKNDLVFSWTEAANVSSYEVTLSDGITTETLSFTDNTVDLSQIMAGTYELKVKATGTEDGSELDTSSKTQTVSFEVHRLYPSYDAILQMKSDRSVQVWGLDDTSNVDFSDGVKQLATSNFHHSQSSMTFPYSAFFAIKSDGSVVGWSDDNSDFNNKNSWCQVWLLISWRR